MYLYYTTLISKCLVVPRVTSWYNGTVRKSWGVILRVRFKRSSEQSLIATVNGENLYSCMDLPNTPGHCVIFKFT